MARTCRNALLTACLLTWLGEVATAQQALPPPPAAPASVVQSSKSMWTGLAITVLACGAGIFVVAKSSARN